MIVFRMEKTVLDDVSFLFRCFCCCCGFCGDFVMGGSLNVTLRVDGRAFLLHVFAVWCRGGLWCLVCFCCVLVFWVEKVLSVSYDGVERKVGVWVEVDLVVCFVLSGQC